MCKQSLKQNFQRSNEKVHCITNEEKPLRIDEKIMNLTFWELHTVYMKI